MNLATSLLIRPIVMRELTMQSERHRLQIESLADIQRLLLPDNPRIAGLEYAVHWQPAETAAGDYYELSNLTEFAPPDFQPTGDDVWGVIIGDVSGHGAAAAMEAVQFDAILRTYRGDGGPPPAAAMTYVNKYFFSRRNRGHFLTAFAAPLSPRLAKTELSQRRTSAAVAQARRRRAGVGPKPIRFHSACCATTNIRNNEFVLESGDVLVLYTDGLVEARDAHEAMFGMARLRDLVASGPIIGARLLDNIVRRREEHQDSTLGTDDQTLIVLTIAH